MRDRAQQDGFVLVQVLGLIAFASAIATIMLTLEDAALQESQLALERSEAFELSLGTEASVVSAFRRDGVSGERLDHYGDSWSQVSQEAIALGYGTVTVDVVDAQALFNVNRLARSNLSDLAMMEKLVVASGLPAQSAGDIATFLADTGPVRSVEDLRDAGLSQQDVTQLSEWVTALPVATEINVNTCSDDLIYVLMGNKADAARLIALRKRSGFVRPDDLRASGIVLTPGLGLETQFLRVTSSATVGRGRARLESLLYRTVNRDGVDVRTVGRRRDF